MASISRDEQRRKKLQKKTKKFLLQEKYASTSSKAYHFDGVYLEEIGAKESRKKEQDAHPELPCVGVDGREILIVHEHEYGS